MSDAVPTQTKISLKSKRFAAQRTRIPYPSAETVTLERLDGGPSLMNVIAHAVNAARQQGLDDCRQYDRAVRAVMRVEPDLTLLAAARLVNAHLEARDQNGILPRYASVITHGTGVSDRTR